uniref:Guanylate binding protein 2 n=1 Tax=Stichopus japonicus TaxID=307972 RepID=A0AB39J5D7_STIJA
MEPYPSVPLCLPGNFIWDSHNRHILVDKSKSRGDITVCKEGLAILDSVKDDYVIVICITGPARTGKSYFLSQFQEGVTFEIGHSTTSKTTGIWIALAPNSVTMTDGKIARLVLLDAEGLGSTSTIDHDGCTERWDRKVFTLCALFSSYLIYNSKGVPTSDDLDKLSFMSQFSSSIQGHLSTPGESMETAVDISPYFMWLIRDAVLQPEVDGQNCTWKKFIISSVLCVEAGAAKNSRNAIKAAIKRSFQNFDAHGIPPPSVDPEVVQNLLLAKYKDQINKKFLYRVEEVKNHVLACAQVKVIKGFPITGQQLALYVSSCVSAVNSESDKLPIQNAWESFLEVKWNDTLIATMEKYDDHANQISYPISTEDIESFHVQESSEVQKAFTEFEASNFDERSVKQYREKLNSALKGKLHTIKTINNTKSHNHCEKVARNLELHLTKVENLDNYTFEELLKGRQKVLEEYLRKAIGPSINEVKEALEERMDGKIRTLQPALIQNTIEAVEEVYEREARDTIQDRLPLETNVIDAEYQRIRELCINQFRIRCRGCDGFLNALSRLETDLRKRLQSLQQTNLSLSNDVCEEAMRSSKRKHFDALWNLVSELNIADLQSAKETALAEYERDARGPAKDKVRKEYGEDMDEKLCRAKTLIAEHALTEAKRDYKRELDELLIEGPLDSREASVKCSSICTKIRKHFERRCDGLDDVLSRVYGTNVTKVESDVVKYFHRRNGELSFEYCDKLMTRLIREILKPSIDNIEMLVSYEEKKTSILQKYDESAKGPKAVDVKDAAVLQIDKDIKRAEQQRVLKGIKLGLQALEVAGGVYGAAVGGKAAKIGMTAAMAAKLGQNVFDKTM